MSGYYFCRRSKKQTSYRLGGLWSEIFWYTWFHQYLCQKNGRRRSTERNAGDRRWTDSRPWKMRESLGDAERHGDRHDTSDASESPPGKSKYADSGDGYGSNKGSQRTLQSELPDQVAKWCGLGRKKNLRYSGRNECWNECDSLPGYRMRYQRKYDRVPGRTERKGHFPANDHRRWSGSCTDHTAVSGMAGKILSKIWRDERYVRTDGRI